MLIKIQLYFIFSYILLVYSRDIILKLDTKQIIDSIITEASVKYITELAEVFAKKAAKTFIEEIKNKEHLLTDSKRAKPVTKKPAPKFRVPTNNNVSKEEILNEEEAYKLLKKPPPDGDHLGWHSQEHSLEESREDTKTVPVYGLMKVNGIYVRRLLGVGVY